MFSFSKNKSSHVLKGGQGSATGGLWAQDKAVVSYSNGSIKVFEAEQEISSFSVHAGSANAVALHPGGSILASVGEDKTYVLYDLESDQVLTQVQADSCACSFPRADFVFG